MDFSGGMGGNIPGQITTRLFNARDGLPDNKVNFFLETYKSPFCWAITRNELTRFDGYRFRTVWENMPLNAVLAENSRGELLTSRVVGSSISCFDPSSGKKTKRDVATIPGLEGNFRNLWAQDTMIFLNMENASANRLSVYRLFPDFKVQHIQSLAWSPEARQEVEVAAKELGYSFSGVDAPENGTDLYGLRYAEFVVPLVKAAQEQNELIVRLQKEIAALKIQGKKIEQLEKELQQIQKLLMERSKE